MKLTSALLVLLGLFCLFLKVEEVVCDISAEDGDDDDDAGLSVEEEVGSRRSSASDDVENDDSPGSENVEGPELTEEQARLQQRIFTELSEDCKNEVLSGRQKADDLSELCQKEVAAIVQRVQSEQQGKVTRDPNLHDPTYEILGFVVLLLAGLAAWGVYAQKNIVQKLPQKPVKPLSKKKLQKIKIKEQRKQQDMVG